MKNVLTLIAAVLFLFTTSCKDPIPPTAVITVVDEDQKVLRNAQVVLDCTPSNTTGNTQICKDGVEETDRTDGDGEVVFEIDLPAVLKAEVTYLRVVGAVTDSLKGDAFVEFKEDEVTEQTITVYPIQP